MKDANPAGHSLNFVLIGISSYEFELFDELCVCIIFSGFCHFSFFDFDLFLEFSDLYKSIPEFISNTLGIIHEVNLF